MNAALLNHPKVPASLRKMPTGGVTIAPPDDEHERSRLAPCALPLNAVCPHLGRD